MGWTRGPVIGRGSTATVSLATAVSTGEIIAVKSMESVFLQREKYFLSKLISCPYIVKYLDFNVTCENGKSMYNLCMEYLPGGSLRDEIRRRGGRLEERTIRYYAHQIVQGLNYMHANGVVHCDLKSENVLIGEGGVKIADLGCAKFAGFATSDFSGTPVFMAPEVARREDQGFAADVWAVGCTIIEMATGANPWPELSHPVSALYRIGFSGEAPGIPGWLSEEAKDFLNKCLRRDPEERWTAEELLEHQFLVGADFGFHENVKEFNTNSNSPCSVLDHGIWDSLEVHENPPSQSQDLSGLNSPLKRIQELIGRRSSSSSSSSYNSSYSCVVVPNWSLDDEDWITIRSNGSEEETSGLENETVSDSISEEELQDSIFDEDLLLLLESSVENVNSSSSSNIVSFSRDDFVLLENLNFETNNDNDNSSSIQFIFSVQIRFSITIFLFLVPFCRKKKIDFSVPVVTTT
ncbi:hypothetical protein ACOSQ3_030876 [Xanthoceras sorbifolium]